MNTHYLTINGQLALSRDLGDKPNDRIIKAFRLREFGRCPKCDNKSLVIWDERAKCIKVIECKSCNTKRQVGLVDIFNNTEGYQLDDTVVLLMVDEMINER